MDVLFIMIALLQMLVIIGLLFKIHLMRKSAKELETAFLDHLHADTNTLIGISSRDKHMCSLANCLNQELQNLRKIENRYRQGDMELKNAITNISHDLRTPLTAICGYLELCEPNGMTEELQQYIEIIKNRTEALKQLTEELFAYSVVVSEETEQVHDRSVEERKIEVDLRSVLEESIAAFYAVFMEKQIVPQIQIPEEPVMCLVDRTALSRVFSNLLSNAVKYSDGDLEITLESDGTIVFANTASGLDEVQVGRLFDRFYTVEHANHSTGLGLSIARMLVEQMQGRISAQLCEGRLVIRIIFS